MISLASVLIKDGVTVEVSRHHDGALAEPLRTLLKRPVYLTDITCASAPFNCTGPHCNQSEIHRTIDLEWNNPLRI